MLAYLVMLCLFRFWLSSHVMRLHGVSSLTFLAGAVLTPVILVLWLLQFFSPPSDLFSEPLVKELCCKCVSWGWAPQGHVLSAFSSVLVFCNSLSLLQRSFFVADFFFFNFSSLAHSFGDWLYRIGFQCQWYLLRWEFHSPEILSVDSMQWKKWVKHKLSSLPLGESGSQRVLDNGWLYNNMMVDPRQGVQSHRLCSTIEGKVI